MEKSCQEKAQLMTGLEEIDEKLSEVRGSSDRFGANR